MLAFLLRKSAPKHENQWVRVVIEMIKSSGGPFKLIALHVWPERAVHEPARVKMPSDA